MNTLKKVAFKLFFILFALPSIAIGIPKPWYHDYFHKQKGTNYKQNCSLIEIAQNIRYTALSAYYRMTNESPESISKQLKEFETWLTDLEEETLKAIKKKYNVPDSTWHACTTDINRIKNYYRNSMHHAHANTIHDNAIPAETRELISMLLQQNNINPHSINLKLASDQEVTDSPSTLAQARMSIFSPTADHNNNLQFYGEYIPATICIFPELLNISEKKGYCAHEVQHLVSCHSITELVLMDYLRHYCSFDQLEFTQSKEYLQLSQIHEAQAELLAAIKNPDIAHSMKTMRIEGYYPGHLYEEHFYHLSTVSMLWNIYAQLQTNN